LSRVDQVFSQLRKTGRKTLIPFLPAGDPSLEVTVALVKQLSQIGCSLCELGFPYSDPIADGPVIQASYARALERGTRSQDIFRAVAELPHQQRPVLVAMVSMAIIHRRGPTPFIESAREAGFDGLIVPDLPHEEAVPLVEDCRAHELSLIPLITPTTSDERARRILSSASGFIYFVSVTGITGERSEIPTSSRERIRRLRAETDLPICVGFGVSAVEQVESWAEVADGVIVGSAIVRRIASARSEGEVVPAVVDFVRDLSAPLAVL
jgi:tryptophan synthase alpha chain